MSTQDAIIALRRFGLGARPGDARRIASDPRGYVLQALANPKAALVNDDYLDPSNVTLSTLQLFQQQRRAAEMIKRERALERVQDAARKEAEDKLANSTPVQGTKRTPQLRPGRLRNEVYQDEATARFDHQTATDAPFLERIAMFWSNHFCVAIAKGNVRALAGSFEREAIRPHVLGRFADMLKAVEQHPAMLIYLDNQLSVGPTSQAGRNREKGLNENLARETLELHTLGVGGGYTQADVTSLANVITGWSIGGLNTPLGEPGKFFFYAPRHEPGEQTVVGKRYSDQGLRAGELVLADLARHPSTARHIATKLARHFVAEQTPPALVERLEKSFRDSDGDLGQLARVLATSPEAWATGPRKIVPPNDFVVSLARGLGQKPKAPEVLRLSNSLGQPLWNPPSPKGWPDDDDAWLAPSAIRERLRVAEQAAKQVDRAIDPRGLTDEILGPGVSTETRQAIARADTREQGFELLIMSPEFQRR